MSFAHRDLQSSLIIFFLHSLLWFREALERVDLANIIVTMEGILYKYNDHSRLIALGHERQQCSRSGAEEISDPASNCGYELPIRETILL